MTPEAFAALVALQLYNLVKSAEMGLAWRPFIIGALVFGVWALASFARTYFASLFEAAERVGLVLDLLQTAFALLFAAGLWQLRQVFYHPERYRQSGEGPPEEQDEDLSDVEVTESG
ncbi:MAG: hypothetical protein HYU66_19635 [Armatimonadetes bacterium]|nr:hypothetical protein [Armatimonadota bacterium]